MFFALFDQRFVGDCHNHQQDCKIDAQQRNTNMVGNQAEQGRHQGGAYISAGGLDTHQGLRFVRTEMSRGGMHDARVNRCAAKAHQNQACHGTEETQGQQQNDNAYGDDAYAQANHLGVGQLHGHKTADGSAQRDTQEEQAGKGGCCFLAESGVECQVRAGPQCRGLLQGAVAKECDHHFLCAGDLDDFAQGQGSGGGVVIFYGFAVPERKAKKEEGSQNELDDAHDLIAKAPMYSSGQYKAHDVRPCGGAYAPHTMEPAHMSAGIMQGHEVIQGGVNAAGPQTVGNGPKAEHPIFPAEGETEERAGGEGYADGGNFAGTQLAG